MVRAYDDNGNVVDLVEWEKQIRVDTIDEFVKSIIEYGMSNGYVDAENFLELAEQLKEQNNENN